ncbi:hypothetical protein M378DRAFT_178570 [Amanita muscaria Koide BX008]|uniref:Uncharacterized protein n=1 Tax=Amanita muscaria (strain Koide BX008) TaxID=946122 RepID=A0A0C2WTJ4_AMAMK|nr:hypothetical protein M378DRAFT_178570 [Amanita muscaria Koide BX008]
MREEVEYPTSPIPSPGSCTSSLHELTDRSSPPFIGPFTTAPEAKMEHKHGQVYSRRNLYRCDGEGHPVSSHCDVTSTSSSSPPALAWRQSTMPVPTFIIEHVASVCRRDSVSPQMAAPERQSGLSRSAPNSAQACVRSLSDVSPVPTPPSASSESTSQSSSPEPGGSMDLRRDRSPNEYIRRMYNILQKPLSSPSPESTQSKLRPRQNSSRSPSHSRSGSTSSLQVTPEVIQPPVNRYQRPVLPQPPRNVISLSSDAAMAIEKSQKEKALTERESESEERASLSRTRTLTETVCAQSDRTAKKQSPDTPISYAQQTGPYHSGGLPGPPHRDTYMSAQPTTIACQKTSGTSASDTLGRRNSKGSIGKPLFLA